MTKLTNDSPATDRQSAWSIRDVSIKATKPVRRQIPDGDRLTMSRPEIEEELRGSHEAIRCDANRNEQVILLTGVCLKNGAHREATIISLLSSLDFDPRHVGAVLKKSAGHSAASAHWGRSSKGVYFLLD